MKKIIALFLCLAMVVGVCTSCGTTPPSNGGNNQVSDSSGAGNDEEPIRAVYISTILSMDYFSYIAASAAKAADENGIELVVWNANGDNGKASEFIDMAVDQGFDAIICTDPFGACASAMKNAKGKVKALIGFDAVTFPEYCNASISSDNDKLGRQCAEHAIAYIKEQGLEHVNLVVSYSNVSASATARRNGAVAAFEDAGIDFTLTEASTSVDNSLEDFVALWDDTLIRKAEGEIDIVIAVDAYNTLATLHAATSAGRDDFKVFGIDDEPDQLAALKEEDPMLLSTIVQDPFEIGRLCISSMIDAINGTDNGVIGIEGQVVTPDTVDQLINDRATFKEETAKYTQGWG